MLETIYQTIRARLQYRAEKRMLERNPYDYVRWVLGMPDATDEELDEAASRMAEAVRASSLTVDEATRGFADMFHAASKAAE